MKKIYSILFLCYFMSPLIAQNSHNKYTIAFIKVWGFLKYYHPALANGKVDWDKEFMNGVIYLPQLESRTAINEYILNRIKNLGDIPACKSCKDTIAGGINYNLKLNWINDTSIFLPETIRKLNYIRNNRNQGQNHYAYLKRVALVVPYSGPTFENEKSYPDSVFPSFPMRMLSLARYWNIVNYYFPYKYSLDQDWDDVLAESVKNFNAANDTLSYHLAILELTTRINDSHSGFTTPQIRKYFGDRRPPFVIRMIDKKPVVDYIMMADSVSRVDGIRRGDVIISVDDLPVANLIAKKMKYIQGSNESAKMRNLAGILLKGNAGTVKLTYQRNDQVLTNSFSMYTDEELISRMPVKSFNPKISRPWTIIDNNIGYINLRRLEVNEVDDAMAALKDTKGIILDLRNYPKSIIKKLGKYFNTEKKAFARLTTPDLSFPGVMKHSDFIYTGKEQPAFYKGKVVVLINEQTQSMAEFTVMALQTGRNVTTIGSQTAGADGDTRKIPLPGGFVATMTGIGIYYPDGRETQRIGIVPDTEVKPTIQGLRSGKDEVLDRAKEYINGNGSSTPKKAAF